MLLNNLKVKGSRVVDPTPILSIYQAWKRRQCLTDEQADISNLRFMSASEASLVLGYQVYNPGVLIPYPGFEYHRVRMLGDTPARFKYLVPRGSGCSPPYCPTILDRDWKDILADPTEPFVITEGELKAICGCIQGVPTLGLGGVEMQATLLTSGIVWSGRSVSICFDHDADCIAGQYKPGVANALGKLCATLITHGALVQVIQLGTLPGLDLKRKWGLDDVLQAGNWTWEQLLATRVDPPQWCSMLAELLDSCVYVVGTNHTHVYNLLNHSRKIPSDFHDSHIEKRRWGVGPSGKPRAEQVSRQWMEHPARVTVDGYGMDPRLPFGVDAVSGTMNLWHGYPVHHGNAPFDVLVHWQAFMEGLFGEHWQWVGLWVGHLLNRPWERTNQAVMLITMVQGIGKSLFGDIVRDLTGVHGMEGSPSRMFGNFNSDMEAKTFVMVNELDVKFSSREGQLNDLLSEETVKIEQKGKDVVVLPNLRRWYFTTNTASPCRLSKGQRRILVVSPPRTFGDTRGDWGMWVDEEISKFRRSEGALAAIRSWFDTLWMVRGADWNPMAPVPLTEAADDAAEASMTVNQILATDLFGVIETSAGAWCAVHPDLRKLNVKVWGEVTAMVKAHGGNVGAKMVNEEGTKKQYTVFDLGGTLGRTKRNDGGYWMSIEMDQARDSAKHMAIRFRTLEAHLTGRKD